MKKTILIVFLVLFSSNFHQIRAQWTEYLLGTSAYPFDCFFINENTGWAAGSSLKVHFTTNAGLNWTLIYSPPINDRFECISFINNNTGWGGTYSGNVRKTTNGGFNWTEIAITPNKRILDIFFINENNGWLIGEDGVFRRTTNGGAVWLTPSNFFSLTGNTVHFVNSQTGFAGGFNNLAKSTNGGINWDITYFPNIFVYVIKFLNQQTGWVIGGRQIVGSATGLYVMKTSNTGANWNVICSDTATYGYHTIVNDSYFITENVAYLVGMHVFAPPPSTFSGLMKKTTDGGISWFSQSGFYNNYSVEAITFVNSQTGFAVGLHNPQGIIYKTTQGGVGLNQISENIPSDFSLHQNYPNPFNPVTHLRFEISELRFVRVVIYDLLGREVATLVNEQLKPGTYEVDWPAPSGNGRNFASGVYFYSLIANEFTETKKMVLLK